MKITGLLTTACLIAFAGAASADCAWGKYESTTAEAQITPIPEAAPEDVAEGSDFVLPGELDENAEG